MLSIDDTSINFKFSKTNTTKAVFLAAMVTFILGFTDFIIGSELSFSIFYLLPITIAVFLSGRALGVIFSFVCAVVWISADISSGLHASSSYIIVWNTLVRLGYFLFHTVILSSLINLVQEVRDLSFHDPLTKAANWRYFEEYSNKMLKVAVRENQKIGLVYLDVDNFKSINDSLGHSIGDELLKTLVGIFKQSIRSLDMVARLGGDEFGVLLINTNIDECTDILRRINDQVLAEMRKRGWNVSLSIGAMVFSVIPSSIGPMLKSVDDLMYEVKKTGKNNIKIVEQIKS